ncbi:MAG: AtpZ/AtpI family protein [Chloroflexi bacterium]|nr:AtpZ/AtpI family protein [Chloroflexota bacterium]
MLHSFRNGDGARQNGVLKGGAEKLRSALISSNKTSKNRENLTPGEAFVGTELFASVVVGALLGWFVGQLFRINSEWPLLIGIAFGAIAGFREIYRIIARGIEEERSNRNDSGRGEPAERPSIRH